MKITVLGAGSWGTTLALVLLSNNHEVTLWAYTREQTELLRDRHEDRDRQLLLPQIFR